MTSGKAVVREARPEDVPAILDLLLAAFQGEDLRPLVSALLADPVAEPRVSLVAEADGKILGHVLFTAAKIETGAESETGGPWGVAGLAEDAGLAETAARSSAALLAPLAVRPGVQGGGIGIRLVEAGLVRLRALGIPLVLVFGNPDYYGRFGFVPAAGWGIAPPYPLPDHVAPAWQGLLLAAQGSPATGRLRPAPAFDDPALWAPPPEE